MRHADIAQPHSTEPAHVWLPRWAQRVFLVLTTLALLLPAADMHWHWDPTPPPDENRKPAPWPPLTLALAELQKWPTQYEAWVRDHFGFRSSLIQWHAKLMLDVLGISPRPDVLLGKDGWLFLGTNKSIDVYRCIFPYTPAGLANEIAQTRERTQALRAKKIAYLNVWAPDKEQIYPEFLPDWVQKTHGPCRMDQLAAALHGAGLSFVDLRGAEHEARKQGLAYHKTDTHWNARGAFFAYQVIAAELHKTFAAFRVLTPAEVRFLTIEAQGGDLARQLDLEKRYAGPSVVEQIVKPRCRPVTPSVQRPEGTKLHAFDCPGSQGPRLLMFGDSFGNALIPFLAESASHFMAVEFGPPIDWDMIAAEKPDIVMEIHVERQMQPDR